MAKLREFVKPSSTQPGLYDLVGPVEYKDAAGRTAHLEQSLDGVTMTVNGETVVFTPQECEDGDCTSLLRECGISFFTGWSQAAQS